jgi:hypothetical protein
MPDKKDLILTAPKISECKTVQLAATKKLSFSTTPKQEDFILLVLDTFGTPTDCIRQSDGGFALEIFRHAIGVLSDKGSQNAAVEGLWQTVIHRLV